jgi:hypothetical protein
MENQEQANPLARWTSEAKKVLLKRTIVDVRYLTDEEMEDMGWYSRPLALFLDNGEHLIISADDEGNDGGAIFYGTNGVLPTL